MPNYTKEQFWKLYEKLPEELKDAIFSEETADNIYEICNRNEIEDEKISKIAKYTGRVLLGVLLPNEFQETLEKKVGLTKNKASKISQEINRFVFYPVKESLASIHKIEDFGSAKPLTPKQSEIPPSEEKKQESQKSDIYREPIE